jgi:hypothetical protein
MVTLKPVSLLHTAELVAHRTTSCRLILEDQVPPSEAFAKPVEALPCMRRCASRHDGQRQDILLLQLPVGAHQIQQQ